MPSLERPPLGAAPEAFLRLGDVSKVRPVRVQISLYYYNMFVILCDCNCIMILCIIF